MFTCVITVIYYRCAIRGTSSSLSGWTVPLRGGGRRIFTREPYSLRLVLTQVLNVCFLLFVVIEMGEPLNKYTEAFKRKKSFIPPALTLQRASSEQVS